MSFALEPWRGCVEFVALGGDHDPINEVLEANPELGWLSERAIPWFFTVPGPHRRVLERLPRALLRRAHHEVATLLGSLRFGLHVVEHVVIRFRSLFGRRRVGGAHRYIASTGGTVHDRVGVRRQVVNDDRRCRRLRRLGLVLLRR
jgi:hypothetical protein